MCGVAQVVGTVLLERDGAVREVVVLGQELVAHDGLVFGVDLSREGYLLLGRGCAYDAPYGPCRAVGCGACGNVVSRGRRPYDITYVEHVEHTFVTLRQVTVYDVLITRQLGAVISSNRTVEV